MSIPTLTPPTDNLYKFVAVSGVALLITSVVMLVQLENQLDRQVTKVRTDLETQGIVVTSSKEPSATTQVTHIPEADAYMAEYRSAQRTGNALNGSAVLGFGMMVGGFGFWYRKVQRFQDQIIAAEAYEVTSKHGK